MENAAGEIIHGDQRIFIEQIREGAHLTAGKFMQGEFPVMMFGLPAAALAIITQLNLKQESSSRFNGFCCFNIILNWYYRTFRISHSYS
ncbi:PTS system transporter subunit IIABC [Staphylococcus aureus]|uniref:PTS system transporter subunit IIABC n=1 Tax=Staphylococcus aureus TaxID=1280 RepID=A0A380DLN7_STAAU|nr:PTS system transporter subunit IIABC [Staphylococcus aureus]